MKTKIFKITTSLALVAGLSLSTAGLASASEISPNIAVTLPGIGISSVANQTKMHIPNSIDENNSAMKCAASADNSYAKAVSLIDPYIEVQTDHLVANVPDSIKKEIHSDVYENLMNSLAQTNALIAEGQLSINAVDPRYGKFRDAGVNGISVHW